MDLPFIKEAVTKLFSKPSCDMYPFVPSEAAEGYRGRISYDPNKCLGCGMCVRVCAGGAITMTKEPVEGGDNITLTFDLGSCTFCNTCADFCSTKSITLTKDYHMIATTENDLIVSGSHVKKKPTPKPKPAAPAAASAAAAKPEEKNAPAEAAAPAVQPRGDGKPVSDPSKCVYCTLCAKKCPAEAITVDRAAKTWTLDEDKCIGCGACEGNCPKHCILF